MKVAIVNTQESFGGAAIAAKRLHHGLLQNGIDSKLWVMDKNTNEENIIGPKNKKERIISRIRAALDSLPIWLYAKRWGMFSVSWWSNRNIISRINSSDADIVHLHWVNAGFLSVSDIGRINKPIVVTLHDMWYFTGGCHYNNTCQRYKQSCGKCPLLASNLKYDLSYFKHKQKKKLYKRKNITFVPLSNWMANELKNSNIATCNDVIKIMLGIFWGSLLIKELLLLGQ